MRAPPLWLFAPLIVALSACASSPGEQVTCTAPTADRTCIGEPEEIEFRGDMAFTRRERDYLHNAARAWSLASCRKKIVITFNLDARDWEALAKKGEHVLVRSTAEEPRGFPGPAEYVGWTTKDSVHIKAYGPCQFGTVALHELGHVMGMGHLPWQGSVMFSACQGGPLELTQRDLDECKDTGICDP